MTLDSLLGVGCVVAAGGLLWLAGMRVLAPLSPGGLERALAVTAAAAAAAVVESLLLGQVGLGTDRLALLAAAAAAFGLAGYLLPPPAVRVRVELEETWLALDARARIAAGATFGLAAAWVGLVLLEPTLDLDTVFYHLPEIADWVGNGHPGTIDPISLEFPIGNYPSTNEVLASWLGGLSRNVALPLLWPAVLAGMLAAAIWLALRTLACPPSIAATAILALTLTPVLARSVSSLDTDLASTAWAAVAVALCVRVATGKAPPELLAVAIVAVGLAVGTKTSAAPLGLAALMVALLVVRRRPRALPVAASTVIATAVGGVWYIRNLLDHGSPLWPFVDTPGADPLPPAIGGFSVTFIDNPIGTLDGRVGQYLSELGAGPLLIAAAIVLTLLSRDRKLMLAGAGVAGGALLWALAPATGAPDGSAAFFTATGGRYLLPTILLATGVLAMVAARVDRVGLAARAALVAALTWGAVDLLVGGDESPSGWVLLAGAALGGAIASALDGRRSSLPRDRSRSWAIPATAATTVVAVAAVAAYPGIFLTRYRDAGLASKPFELTIPAIPALLTWFDQEPDFDDDEAGTIRFAGTAMLGPLTGGAFEHDLDLVTPEAGCDGIDASAEGWLVVGITSVDPGTAALACVDGEEPQVKLAEGSGLEIQVFRLGRPG